MPKTTTKPAAKKIADRKKPAGVTPAKMEARRRNTTVEHVPVADIDPDPAAGVRADTDDAVVAEYAAADRGTPGCLPEVDVFRGPKQTHLGDGGNRYSAMLINKRETIRAKVRTYKTDSDARLAAVLHACGANAAHGRRRSSGDKRRAVEQYLTTRELGVNSDPAAATACRVDKSLVKAVRMDLTAAGRLTGRASADGRYTASAGHSPDHASKVEPPYTGDGQSVHDGSDVSTTAPASDELPATTRTPASGSAAGSTAGPPEVRPAAPPTGDPDPPAERADAPSPIPERLAGYFAELHLITAATQAIGGLDRATALHGVPGFTALADELNELAVKLNRMKPRYVCPWCHGAGTVGGGTCPTCEGLGWGVYTTTGAYADPVRVPPASVVLHPAAEAEPDPPGAIDPAADDADDGYEWLVPDTADIGDGAADVRSQAA